MKKVLVSIFVALGIFMLTACGDQITVKDLKSQDWIVESKEADEPNIIMSFDDQEVTFGVDTSNIKSTAKNDWEVTGEELAKAMFDQMSFKIKYTLKNNEIVLKNEKKDAKFKVKKDGKNLAFTPDKNNNSDNNKELILKPYKKKKTDTSKKPKSSQTRESSSSSRSIESTTISETVHSKEETNESIEPQASLADFVGGWGVPNSDDLFFINADGTFSSISTKNASLGLISFSVLPDGRYVMNTDNGELVKELDGSLTSSINGQRYQYLGNITIEEFILNKN